MRRYLAARITSWAGSSITLVALPVLLYQRTGDAALTGLLTAMEAVPYLLLGLPAGALADRWDRRRVLTLTSLLSALLVASVPLAAALGLLTTPHLFVVAAATSSSFVFFDAAAFGALPALVGREGVARATGVLMTWSTLVSLVGPALAGVLVAATGAAPAMGIDALSYVAAALLLARLPLAKPEPRPRRDLRAEILDGVRYIRAHPVVGPLTFLGVGNSLAEGAVMGLLVVVAVERLGLGSADPAIGLLFAATAVGAMAAGLAVPRLRLRFSTPAISLTSLTAVGILLVVWALTEHLVAGLVVLAVWQAANSLVSLNGIIERQERTPDHLQGRVNTTARMIAWGGQPAGAALAGLLAELTSPRTALLATAAAVLLSLLLPPARALARLTPSASRD
ncbi:MFS transporter [Streptosporangium saharense]|uniref:MFS family permease n=1 Tax=Streptosporangium saharense TaxID=1706840 RepID=A0A7W7QLT4_9ACTN|nr:MFS transporter [Streptosporangium saharense]MBB4915967.1 MFS family permease [Streptosporangium saharense]